MTPRTIFLAKLMGLFAIALALAMVGNRGATAAAFVMLLRDPAALWLAGMAGLAAGLALVLCHNVWSGGAPTVVVTVVGWVILVKGVALLLVPLPPGTLAALSGALLNPAFLYADSAFLFALGLYLAVAGFKASRRPDR